nr:hypothetical protein [Haliscomenobacter sp.]
MTGYQPNYAFLRNLGIEIESEGDCLPVHSPETLETNLPNVYLAGVVCAGARINKLFIENTRDHGEMIAQRVKEKLVGVLENYFQNASSRATSPLLPLV